MSTGFRITNSNGTKLSWNLSIGYDQGFSLDATSDNILEGNIAIGKEVLDLFGQEFRDVAIAVQKSKDYEALAALASVVREAHSASLAWSILIRKFGTKIGQYDVNAFLVGILSSASWDALKIILKGYGIDI
jgi:hypothetical protein